MLLLLLSLAVVLQGYLLIDLIHVRFKRRQKEYLVNIETMLGRNNF